MSEQWISVDDKLPGDDRCVLCWLRVGGCVIAAYDGHLWGGEENGVQQGVTHWRELPPSPVEEAGNE